jgi:hypothetical protein
MGLFDELQQPQHPRRQDYKQFTNRYEQGAPDEGYDDQEVSRRYNEVAGSVDPQTFRTSAQQALGRMQPAQRRQFGQMVQQQAAQRGHKVQYDGQSTDPGVVANLASDVHQQDPGLLSQLLGGVTGGSSGGQSASGSQGVVGGLVSNAAGSVLGDSASSNPIAKAALAGITSYATKSLTGGS